MDLNAVESLVYSKTPVFTQISAIKIHVESKQTRLKTKLFNETRQYNVHYSIVPETVTLATVFPFHDPCLYTEM